MIPIVYVIGSEVYDEWLLKKNLKRDHLLETDNNLEFYFNVMYAYAFLFYLNSLRLRHVNKRTWI